MTTELDDFVARIRTLAKDRHSGAELDKVEAELPPALFLAKAIARNALPAISSDERAQAHHILNGLLQLQLTREHVEAQKQMGKSADKLAKAANNLSWASVIFAGITFAVLVAQGVMWWMSRG